MNKAFRTIWNDVRQSFVTTSEIQTSHGKRTKSSLSLCIATALFTLSGVASAAYVEPGVIGSTSSWETPEYQKDWGLEAMNASAAYSLGYNGQKTALGMMDSGALLYTHPELDGERFRYITQQGKYTSTGNRYPQGAVFDGAYTKDESFDTTGKWILGVNDSHGTHVLGTIAANRDGANHHGVAWNSTSYSANTGGSDDSNYGPFLDYGFFYNGWKTLADALVKDNGKDRGGVINNSFGTNIRVYRLQQMIGGNWTDAGNLKVSDLNKVDGVNFRIGPRLAHIPTNTVAQAEYEYFLHNKIYGAKGIKSFVDAAWDAVKGTNVVQVFTTGNRDMHNPFYRPLYPYFNPEAENNWVAVAGLMKRGDRYELISSFNEAGLGKYWTVAAPGSRIYSSAVVDGSYVEPNTGTDSNGDPVGDLGSPSYQTWGGTSMAAPHVTGAMGVLMSRYQSMTAPQVREVMFTTANHKNPDGTDMVGWENVEVDASGAVVRTWAVPEGEVSNRMGWGVPDLNKGMYGPGQLLGKFDYNMNLAPLDVWTNDISEVALKQREREDLEWMAKTKNGTDASTGGSYELGNDFVVVDGDSDATNHVISEDDAQKWRSAYFLKRAQAIQNKIDNNLYQGSLVKRGSGMLIMTGNNTYSGGTTVEDGALYGFSESFGSGNVNVNGGVFGVLSSFNDNFTQKGQLNSLVDIARAPIQKANIVVNNGGTYAIVADPLVASAKEIEKTLEVKARDFKSVVRLGRTGLQDALPMTWGQVFAGWLRSVQRAREQLESLKEVFSYGVLGGTAVGTGMGVMPGYPERIFENLSKVLGFTMKQKVYADEVIPNSGIFDGMRNTDHHSVLMEVVKELVASVTRIANDLLLYASGPRSGINEVKLPMSAEGTQGYEHENTAYLCEMMTDVLGEMVIAEDMTFYSANEGQLDHGSINSGGFITLVKAIKLASHALSLFNNECLKGVEVNEELLRSYAEKSTSLSTMVGSLFGYPTGVKIAKQAIAEDLSCKEVAIKEHVLPEDVCEEIFDVLALTDRNKTIELFKKYRNIRKVD